MLAKRVLPNPSLRFLCKLKVINRTISYYITTPVFYVNSAPHIGHVHTLLLADALHTFHRLKLNTTDTKFSTGTDEHGIKIQSAADSVKLKYADFCQRNSHEFVDLFSRFDTTLTDFIRTSEERHQRAVESIWNELNSRGYIYKSQYSGWYCVSDENFVPESQITKEEINGVTVHFDQQKNPLVWYSEENYMFRLHEFRDRILHWLLNEKPIQPRKFNGLASSMLSNPETSGDLSISRPSNRLKWGIQVPGDPAQKVYVWLDALTNYLTVVGYPCKRSELERWPIDCQVFGKDILKFHAIYWPAFLLSLSLPLPKRLICHSHWLVDNTKMSKSKGNTVNPSDEMTFLTTEGLRYYLLRSATPHCDTDYNRTQAMHAVNAELADTYGNLINRCSAKSINPQQMIPTRLSDGTNPRILEILEHLSQVVVECDKHYNEANFYRGVDQIMKVLKLNNALYQEAAPWKLVKEINTNDQSYREYHDLQAVTFETIRICSILLQPIVPKMANLVLDQLNVGKRSWRDSQIAIKRGDPHDCQRKLFTKDGCVLFRRLKL